MNHYGYEKFIIEKIEDCINRVDMDSKEKYWIQHYKSNDSNYGYNMTDGGGGKLLPNIYIIIGKKVSIANFVKEWEENHQKIV